MEACNFGHGKVVDLLLSVPGIDLEAVNLRGQRADEVASTRGHEALAAAIATARSDAENPEEMPRIRQLEAEAAGLRQEARRRLTSAVEDARAGLRELKARQEEEIEPLSARIDQLQGQLDQAMKQRMAMITRYVL